MTRRGRGERPSLTSEWLIKCGTPGCPHHATYLTRTVLAIPGRASPRCVQCTYDLGEWMLKHWNVARLDVRPLS